MIIGKVTTLFIHKYNLISMDAIDDLKKTYPDKFVDAEKAFTHIRRGNRIFIGTGCGEPQYLVRKLVAYVESHPKAFVDAEIFHIWTLGVTPYTEEKFQRNFRHNAFFIGGSAREAVNKGMADYTPIFLSKAPDLFRRGIIPIDVALIQLSMPDVHGYMSYGISVDTVKSATENAKMVMAQVNKHMPRTHGDSFIHVEDVDFIIPFHEPLLEYPSTTPDETYHKIGKYVARLVEDGSTIQVGYGNIPDGILSSLKHKKDLGIHTELLTDGIVRLMKEGVITNRKKSIHKGKTVAAFCMGSRETYEYLHDNPEIEMHPIEYTNNPLVIAQNTKMIAINTALQVDLTGQATAESLGHIFYSGVGGQADFMRGALLGGGKTILALPSTAKNGEVSRIVPFLQEGAGVTLTRGDTQYVVTEYGIAYLQGKNIRERAMELISIAHPKFRTWLLEEAKKYHLVFQDQTIIPGMRGQYPEEFETWKTTKKGLEVFLRPVKMSDEPILKEFFYSLSDQTIYKRFISARTDMPHERLQEFCIIDYRREMVILATIPRDEKEEVIGVGQYAINEDAHTAEVAFVVRDDYQNRGVGRVLLEYLTEIAKKQGLLGFTAEVLSTNKPMLKLFEQMGFHIQKRLEGGIYILRMLFS